MAEEVLRLYRERYFDFNVSHFLRETHIREHNRRFAQAPLQPGSAFVEVPKGLDLNKVFCFKHERTNCDNTVSFKKRLFQIAESRFGVSFARCKVTVYEHLDSSVSIGYGPHILGYYSSEGLPKNARSRKTKSKEGRLLLITTKSGQITC